MTFYRRKIHFILILFLCGVTQAQEFNFKLKSKVEVRNWKLSNRAMKSAAPLNKASVELHSASGIVSTSESDANGHFELNIPSNGEYTLVVNAAGQNPKRYIVHAKGSPVNKNDANFKPSIDIVGIITTKHTKDMNYVGLSESHVSSDQNKTTYVRSNIYDGEQKLIQKFCTANKLGDIALEKKNYSLAKTFYMMATDMMEGEPYPKEQIKKAEEGMKLEKLARKKQTVKQSKLKSAVANQKTSSGTSKTSSPKTSVGTGKATRKTRMTLGK